MTIKPKKDIKTVTIAFANTKSSKNLANLDALRDRLKHHGEIAGMRSIKPAKQSLTNIFRPEAEIVDCKIDITSMYSLENRYRTNVFEFYKNYPWQYAIETKGDPDEIQATCQRICDLLGLACLFTVKQNQFLSVQETIKPQRGIHPVAYGTVLYDNPKTA